MPRIVYVNGTGDVIGSSTAETQRRRGRRFYSRNTPNNAKVVSPAELSSSASLRLRGERSFSTAQHGAAVDVEDLAGDVAGPFGE